MRIIEGRSAAAAGREVARTGEDAASADTAGTETAVSAPVRERVLPARPTVRSPNSAPVLTKLPPPFTVRLAEFLWILALLAGALTVVYYFVIREDQTPLIADAVRGIQAGRPDETYDSAADIVFWAVFWIAAAMLVAQIALLVSFMNRRNGVRWWQLGTLVVLTALYLLSLDVVAGGERGELLRSMFLGQVSLGVLGLLVSCFTGALAWTARRHDIRRAGDGSGAEI